MAITVRKGLTAEDLKRVLEGTTAVIERGRGPSYFGERGVERPWFNVSTPTGRVPLAQGDTLEECREWALKAGARRVEVID